MNTLLNMRIFVRVAETGTFTAAAESLHTNATLVSRAVTELEQHLRILLLTRSTRRIVLTAAGRAYLVRCRGILGLVEEAEQDVFEHGSLAQGVLRIHSFASFGHHHIVPAINAYRKQYPAVRVDLQLSQNLPDLFDGTCDTSILVVSGLPNSEIVMQRLGSTYTMLCASHDYLGRRGIPYQPHDLANHECLALTTPTLSNREWVLKKEGTADVERVTVNSVFRTNLAETLAAAIRAGMGIGPLPVYAALAGLREGTLIRVLPEYALETMDIYALFPSRRFVDARTRTWSEFMREYLPAALARDRASLALLRSDCVRPGSASKDEG